MSPRETIQRVRSVRLVAPDDPDYLAAMAEQALAHRRFGPKDVQSATYRVSGRVEMAVRGWLAERVPILAERVIGAQVLYRGERSYTTLFLELDAVQGRDGIPSRVFEVKFTSNAAALRRGFAQLARASSLLEARYDRIDTAVVLVQAQHGPLVIDDPRLEDVVPVDPETLADDGALPPRALLCLDPESLLPFLGEEDRALLQAAREEGDANVLARLERSAAIGRGEEVALPAPSARPGATLSFGDEPAGVDGELADSPFAALRGLAGGGGRPGRGGATGG
ncbi:MAG: hypothetical protein ACP5VP_09020 [Candidatus Limnocylindrales bacterium]